MAGHIIYVHATIPAGRQTVWDVITDVEHADQVFRSVHDSTLVSDGPFGVGTTWREKRSIFGHRGEEELHVVECEPPGALTIETRLRNDVVRTVYRLTSFGEGDHSTRLAMTTSVQMQDRSAVERLAWKFFGGFSYEHTHRMLEHDLEDITAEVARRKQVSV
ncbi:MAG TPA: hypothetical protein VNS55_13990 [Nocardioides sp.]|nr:hypothetical protein [Nocardioides sp.]